MIVCPPTKLMKNVVTLLQNAHVGLFFLQMIFRSNKAGKAQHFSREYDKKVNLLGLVSLMGLPEQATLPQLQAAWPQLMAGVMRLLIALKEQQVHCKLDTYNLLLRRSLPDITIESPHDECWS